LIDLGINPTVVDESVRARSLRGANREETSMTLSHKLVSTTPLRGYAPASAKVQQ
jgi:hypothetical protein